MIRRFISLVAVAFAFVAGLSSKDLGVDITLPANGSPVPWRTCFQGTVTEPNANVYVVIHPLEISDYYVQPEITVRANGTYTLVGYIAENRPNFEGKHFEIMALANPSVPLRDGQRLGYWPEAQARSHVIEVIRKDGAPSGCGDEVVRDVAPAPARQRTGIFDSPPNARPLDGLTRATRDVRVYSPNILPALSWMFILIFLALIALPGRAEEANQYLGKWLAAAWGWLASIGRWATATLVSSFRALRSWGDAKVAAVWQAKGSKPSLKEFTLSAFRVVSLTTLFWLALIADARAILYGLGLIFQTPIVSGAGAIGSIFAPSHEQLFPQSADVSGFHWVFEPFVSIWREPLGPMAVGLAAVQAAFGLILFWGLGQTQTVRTTLRVLLRERFIACSCFLVLCTALASLAGYRGFELSPEQVNGIIPASIAALIALVMPWVMAYALHYALESLSDFAGATGAGCAVGCLFLANLSVMGSWTAILLFLASGSGCLFASFLLIRVVLGILLWAAGLFGEIARGICRFLCEITRQPAQGGPAFSLARIGLIFLAFLSLLALTALQLQAQPSAQDYSLTIHHDPGEPHNAWVFCADTSRSISPEQFTKMKRVMQHSVATDIKYNDLVWLIQMTGESQAATLFEMPRQPIRHSERGRAEEQMQLAKRALVNAIGNLEQLATTTDLRDPIELGLNLLQSRPRAITKSLIIGSDYVQDAGPGKITSSAPKWANGLSANGIRVALLVAHPKVDYLRIVQLSPAELYNTVGGKWSKAFQEIGAKETATQFLDAVPTR